jgi:hypothetical protein
MKSLLCLLLVSTFSLTAWGDCTEAYQKASKRRDIRNEVIAVAAGAAALGVAPTLFPTATIYFVGKYTLTVLGVVTVTEIKKQGVKIYKNNFDQLLGAFEAARDEEKNFYLRRLIKGSIKRAGLQTLPDIELRAQELIAEGFKSDAFCPVVGVDRKGREKKSVFRKSAVLDYVAVNLKEDFGSP